MKKINNLIYSLEIKYINNSGLATSVSVKFHDTGLKIKSIQVGTACITEETINGRILSGRFDNSNGYCGYRYDYQNGENLLNINPKTPLENTISIINKTKMDSAFISADLVLSSILRGDYRVVILNNGKLNVTKTISAENEKSEHCSLQECSNLLKLDGEDLFIELDNKIIYRIDDAYVVEENKEIVDSDIKSHLIELLSILNQNPQNYKELIELKNQIQKNIINNSINEEKTL